MRLVRASLPRRQQHAARSDFLGRPEQRSSRVGGVLRVPLVGRPHHFMVAAPGRDHREAVFQRRDRHVQKEPRRLLADICAARARRLKGRAVGGRPSASTNVLATNHIVGVTHGARHNMASMAARQIIEAAYGGRPPRLVNPVVWPSYVARFERLLGRSVLVTGEASA